MPDILIGGADTLAALRFTPGPRGRRLSRVVRGVAIAFVLMMVGCGPVPPGYDASEHRRAEQVVAGFAPTLERYRQEHGEYPPNLQAAGIATPQTLYGPLRYRTWREYDGLSIYEVSFGDYDRNGFVATYNSLGEKWSLNT
ncbi:MAG TPA: hypothetical protein VF006_24765 [Longimicrobium sp.]